MCSVSYNHITKYCFIVQASVFPIKEVQSELTDGDHVRWWRPRCTFTTQRCPVMKCNNCLKPVYNWPCCRWLRCSPLFESQLLLKCRVRHRNALQINNQHHTVYTETPWLHVWLKTASPFLMTSGILKSHRWYLGWERKRDQINLKKEMKS